MKLNLVYYGFFNFITYALGEKLFIKQNARMIGKTEYIPIPIEQWLFQPTATEASRTEVMQVYRDIQIPCLITKANINTSAESKIKPTIFIDFRKSREYKRLWNRTHRGFHWLPPKPTISPC